MMNDDEIYGSAETPNENEELLTCPHCWHLFTPSQLLAVARHPDLTGDLVLGENAQIRFLPTSYNADGVPLDARGVECQEMACPRCHLQIPEAFLEYPNTIVSIVGAPSAGKSYFLTALVFQLKRILLDFGLAFADADTVLNQVLTHYENLLFRNSQDKLVSLPKTELQGNDFSSQVLLDGISMNLPLPFVYSLRPMGEEEGGENERNIVFYDNAGEHFEPGRDLVTNMATHHLAKSECFFFLFDPFKDNRLLPLCKTTDEQAGLLQRDVNQMQIFNEMIVRLRKTSRLPKGRKYEKPLIFVLPKLDAWEAHFKLDLKDLDYRVELDSGEAVGLNIAIVKLASYILRDFLLEHVPELVSVCESFFERVYYVPVSALGCTPEFDKEKNVLGVHPMQVHPLWVEVPMLIYLWESGTISGLVTELSPDVKNVSEFCKIQGESMYFKTPQMPRAKLIPRIYWGAEVYDSQLGFIRFPNAND